MTTSLSKLAPALILTVGILGAAVAVAEDPQPDTQLTIRAERPTKLVLGHTTGGVPVEAYQLSYRVRFADLDLGTKAGADALKARVFITLAQARTRVK